MADQQARQDGNKFPALTAHTGTAGTAEVVRVVANAAGAITTSGSVTVDTINSVGTLNTGTITRLLQGSVNVTAGTVNAGTVDLLKAGTITRIEGGTITVTNPGGAGTQYNEDAGHTTGDAGMQMLAVRVDGGTSLVDADINYAPLQVDANGALRVSGTVATGAGTQAVRLIDGTLTEASNLAKGTITRLEGGTVGLVTTVSNLSAGSVAVTAGTVGGKAASGAAAVANPVFIAGTDAGGTIYGALVDNTGKLQTTTTLGDLSGGTVDEVTLLKAGTITKLEQGSIQVTAGTIGTVGGVAQVHNAGTLQAGTIKLDGRTGRNILTYGTTFAGTAAAYGTLVGSAAVGAGTSTWVQSISMVNPAGAVTCMVGFGTALNGTSVLAKASIGTNYGIGIEKEFPLAVNAGMTNQDLVCYVSAAATIDVNVSYFISA